MLVVSTCSAASGRTPQRDGSYRSIPVASESLPPGGTPHLLADPSARLGILIGPSLYCALSLDGIV